MNKPKIYHGDWEKEGWEHLKEQKALEKDFEITLTDENILFAVYTYEDYSGKAFVLFEKDGKLYEVNGSHCSCNGLEGQWQPEETSVEALKFRLLKGSVTGYDKEYDSELAETIKWLNYVAPQPVKIQDKVEWCYDDDCSKKHVDYDEVDKIYQLGVDEGYERGFDSGCNND